MEKRPTKRLILKLKGKKLRAKMQEKTYVE